MQDFRKTSVTLSKIDINSINYSAFDSSDVALSNGQQIEKSKNFTKIRFFEGGGGLRDGPPQHRPKPSAEKFLFRDFPL